MSEKGDSSITPYKQEVTGSSPVLPTINPLQDNLLDGKCDCARSGYLVSGSNRRGACCSATAADAGSRGHQDKAQACRETDVRRSPFPPDEQERQQQDGQKHEGRSFAGHGRSEDHCDLVGSRGSGR